MKRSSDEKQCPYQYGEPFTGFWKQFDITFPKHRAIDDGGYMSFRPNFHAKFKERFSDMKVMAFFGNPGAFPSIEQEQEMQKFIRFSPETEAKVREYIYRNMGAKHHNRPGTETNHISENYIAVHARIGIDMENACKNHFKNVYRVVLQEYREKWRKLRKMTKKDPFDTEWSKNGIITLNSDILKNQSVQIPPRGKTRRRESPQPGNSLHGERAMHRISDCSQIRRKIHRKSMPSRLQIPRLQCVQKIRSGFEI